MRRVYKYPVLLSDRFHLDLPVGAKILSVNIQHGNPQMWALVDPDCPLERRFFRLAGTGHPIEDTVVEHVGTFRIANGDLVFHLFEEVSS